MLNMIYFDNAATGGKKPEQVLEKAVNVMKYLSVNAGRSAHKLAVFAEREVYECRKDLADFFNAENVERVIFTKNCTEALNLAIFGTLKKGGNVITSVYEHNSVLRPLYALKKKGLITLTIIKPSKNRLILKEDIEKAIRKDTYLVCLTSASNVTGEISDYESIGAFLKNKGILFLLDGAQGAGHLNINLKAHNIDMFCFSAHKGLDGIQGVGGLIFNSKTQIEPLLYGGSGSETFAEYPSSYPELLESGTLNLPAILSLREAIFYTKINLPNKQAHLINLTAYLINELKKIKGVALYSTQNPTGIVSFSYKDHFSQEVTGILSQKFDIAARGGFHCAPLTHEFLKTNDNGLIRCSFSQYNTFEEINEFIYAMQRIDGYLF